MRGLPDGSKDSSGRMRTRLARCQEMTHGSLPVKGRGRCPTQWASTGISLVLDPGVVSPFLVVLSNVSDPLALPAQTARTQGPTQTAPEARESAKSKAAPGGDGDPPSAEGAPNSS